jgi:aryl-alcohol dehydrogenase-like predicted oxidoreductase
MSTLSTRKLGWTDLQLTTLGLGTWAMGGGGWKFGWGAQDDQQSIATIYRALDLGINWLDTAPIYGLGRAEEIVGRALAGMARKPIIATKCSRKWTADGTPFGCLKRQSVRAEIEASLRRLKVEVIDLYQVHRPEPEADIEEAWEEIARAIKAGKIRYAGVSNFTVAQMKRLQPIHPIASVQPNYSMLVRDIEKEILPFCAENKIGVVSYSPMLKGLLTGKMTQERIQQLPPDDHRRNDPRFNEPELTKILAFVEALRPIAAKHGKTVGELAIAWVLRRPEITSAIVGARRPSQIEETVGAADLKLNDGELLQIWELQSNHAERA